MLEGDAFALSNQVVHVWYFPLQAASSVVALLEQTLSADERERAARFYFDYLRLSYICSRGALRYLLGLYLHLPPAGLRFHYGLKGKPFLAGSTSIRFNLARAGNFAAVALTTSCEIGIDLEPIRRLEDVEQIARRFFCPEESAEILALPQAERAHAFCLCWTRKEAYIKAVGEGLSLPLSDFRVSVRPQDPARFVHIGHSAARATDWTLQDLSLAPNFAAAIAYAGQPKALTIFSNMQIADLVDIVFPK